MFRHRALECRAEIGRRYPAKRRDAERRISRASSGFAAVGAFIKAESPAFTAM